MNTEDISRILKQMLDKLEKQLQDTLKIKVNLNKKEFIKQTIRRIEFESRKTTTAI